jgi:hypothetical protein
VSVTSARLRYRAGKIAVTLACEAPATCRGRLRLAKGATTIAARSYAVGAGKRAKVSLRPTRRGRAVLARARTHRVTVQLRPRGGKTVARKLTLRR